MTPAIAAVEQGRDSIVSAMNPRHSHDEIDVATVTSDLCAILTAGLVSLGAAGPAFCDSPPRPQVDFFLRGQSSPAETEVRIAHRQGRLRVDVMMPDAPSNLTGFIDLDSHKMAVLTSLPGMGRVALEIDLPPEYVALDMPVGSEHAGTDIIIGENCDVWKSVEKTTSRPIEACITADGVPLRSVSYTDAGKKVRFEAVALARTPLPPEAVMLPRGVKVTRLPASLQNMAPLLGQ